MEISGALILWDLGIIVLTATFLGLIARVLKQPLILAYVVAGVLIGPAAFRLITSGHMISTFAEMGIAFLLFMVGLELDLSRLKQVGRVSVLCGLGQIAITFVFGFLLSTLLGFQQLESFYIAFILTISSTMVVIKLLSDKNELDTLHGKIALGILLVQDIVTILVLALLTNIGSLSLSTVADPLLKGLGLVSIAIVAGVYVTPFLLRYIARSIELLFLFALSWCFVFAASSFVLGLSIGVGAFLAGLSLAAFPYNIEIIGRIKSLRDFFATIFFVSLGMQIPAHLVFLPEAIIFSLFVLLGNILIVLLIVTLLGYKKRTSFLSALYLAQISEFSLIMASEGLRLGHISYDVFSMIIFIGVTTITISSYFIIHGPEIYRRMSPVLRVIDRISKDKELEHLPKGHKNHVIVFGCKRMGYKIVRTLQKFRRDFLVVDINPDVIDSLICQTISCIYGDIGDFEILDRINLKNADAVISTVPDQKDNLFMIDEIKRVNADALIVVTSDDLDGALRLYNAGADYVMLPRMLAGDAISEFMERHMKCGDKRVLGEHMKCRKRLDQIKSEHIMRLEEIKRDELLRKYEPSFLKALEKKFDRGRDHKEY
ncbi:MAG: cation:proton antiporter [Candidatus Altiarchaeales archaeon]|nr:cation:proton antiporter [Candidatus Altiarchaeales archaeon]